MPVHRGSSVNRFAHFADANGQITKTLSIPATCPRFSNPVCLARLPGLCLAQNLRCMNGEQKDFLSVTPPASAGVTDTGIRAEQNQTSVGEAGFIDQKQLLARLPISRRTLFNWRTSGKIPCVRLGGRRILFHWPSVEAALLRHQHGGQS